jgi:hypothetical protein
MTKVSTVEGVRLYISMCMGWMGYISHGLWALGLYICNMYTINRLRIVFHFYQIGNIVTL